LSAFIHLSVGFLLIMNLLEEHRRNGKKQPKLVRRDRPKTAKSAHRREQARLKPTTLISSRRTRGA
jgi:hypothetical protein